MYDLWPTIIFYFYNIYVMFMYYTSKLIIQLDYLFIYFNSKHQVYHFVTFLIQLLSMKLKKK